MTAILARLHTLWGVGRAAADDLELVGSDEPDSGLFHCPSCGVVYIAVEKETCSNCEGAVEQVPSTLTCG